MFDKDDGLVSAFEDTIKGFDYMNECFKKWESANYVFNLSEYCKTYAEHIDQ